MSADETLNMLIMVVTMQAAEIAMLQGLPLEAALEVAENTLDGLLQTHLGGDYSKSKQRVMEITAQSLDVRMRLIAATAPPN